MSISACSTTYLGNNIYSDQHLDNPMYPTGFGDQVGSLCLIRNLYRSDASV